MTPLPGRAESGLGRVGAVVSASTPLARLLEATRAIAAEPALQRMLRVAARELTLMLSAEACLISKLEDGLLKEVADFSTSDRQVARGVNYYLADYPATAEVLDSGVLRSISTADPAADPGELFVLREMEMAAVLLIPVSCSSFARWRWRRFCWSR